MERILYVEDDLACIDLMPEVLRADPDVEFFSTGWSIEAVNIANNETPDLVFIDIKLGVVDGYEILRMIRAEPGTHNTPVIDVMAAASPAEIAKGEAASFDGQITEPYDLTEVNSAVNPCHS